MKTINASYHEFLLALIDGSARRRLQSHIGREWSSKPELELIYNENSTRKLERTRSDSVAYILNDQLLKHFSGSK